MSCGASRRGGVLGIKHHGHPWKVKGGDCLFVGLVITTIVVTVRVDQRIWHFWFDWSWQKCSLRNSVWSILNYCCWNSCILIVKELQDSKWSFRVQSSSCLLSQLCAAGHKSSSVLLIHGTWRKVFKAEVASVSLRKNKTNVSSWSIMECQCSCLATKNRAQMKIQELHNCGNVQWKKCQQTRKHRC